MAYSPLHPILGNGSIFNQDHLAHIENGILGTESSARDYVDQVATEIQAGQVTDPAFDAAVDRAVADGRLDLEGGATQDLTITETTEGVYTIADGTGEILGLTAGKKLPAAAKLDLESTFPTKDDIQAEGFLKDVPDTAVAGHITAGASATRGALDARYAGKAGLPVNVQDPKYGYVKGADNTAAIDAAWADATTGYRALYFPAGDYTYNGPGLGGVHPIIHGAGRERTKITLGASSRLFDTAGSLGSLDFSGFTLIGGLGLFRSTNTGGNVAGTYRVTNIHLKGYTSAAVEVNANDMPYWKFRDLIFDGANFTSTIGIALSGLTDGCSFENIEFLRNRVHIKMRYGGNNAYVRNCDFLRFGASQGQPRVDVWLVPRNQATNSGAGFNLSSCKFGAENLDPADKRIVYADESTGATNGAQFPVLDAASTGFISGHRVSDVMAAGTTGAGLPLVFSTTPNVRGCSWGDINLQGTTAEHIVQFLNPLAPHRLNTDNIIGPVYGAELAVDGAPSPSACSSPGFAHVVDPAGLLTAGAGSVNDRTVGDPIRYLSLSRTPAVAYAASGNVTVAETTDSLGGTDARTATFTGTGAVQIVIPNAATVMRPGEPVWIEFDAKAGTLPQLRAVVEQSGGTVFHFSRVVRLGAGWHRFRFLWVPRSIPAGQQLMLRPLVTTGGTFSVGRVRIYHAQEPLDVDGLTVIGGVVHRLSVVNGVVNATAI